VSGAWSTCLSRNTPERAGETDDRSPRTPSTAPVGYPGRRWLQVLPTSSPPNQAPAEGLRACGRLPPVAVLGPRATPAIPFSASMPCLPGRA
jgi:hypothetical protein